MILHFDYINIALVFSTLANIFLFLALSLKSRESSKNFVYFINIFFIILWSLSMIFYRAYQPDVTVLRTLYLFPTFIASTFLHFSILYSFKKKINSIYVSLIYIINILMAAFTFFTSNVVVMSRMAIGEKVIIFGRFYWVYILYISLFFFTAFLIIYLKGKTLNKDRSATYLLSSYVFGSSISLVTNLLLPWFGFFEYQWLGQVVTLVMVLSVVYSIFKYNIFQIRLLFTQLFIFLIISFSIFRIIFNSSKNDLIISIIYLIVICILGYYFVRFTIKEQKQKQDLEELYKKQKYYSAQLETLDQRKTDFINIASHQLRTPQTAISGFVELILDGSYGDISDNIKEKMIRIRDLSKQSITLINDMLNVTKIESNKLLYKFLKVDINNLILNISKNFESIAKNKNLYFDNKIDQNEVMLNLDKNLITQSIENIIENAIKYTKTGHVKINTYIKSGTYYFICEDSGIGIDKDSIPNLFQKFGRAKNAIDSGIEGSGIGIFLAKSILSKHGGDLVLESKGVNMGTKVTMSIDINKNMLLSKETDITL